MSHRILMVLRGIMRHFVLRGRLDRNPVQPVRVPLKTGAIRTVRLLAPLVRTSRPGDHAAPATADHCSRAATAPPGQ